MSKVIKDAQLPFEVDTEAIVTVEEVADEIEQLADIAIEHEGEDVETIKEDPEFDHVLTEAIKKFQEPVKQPKGYN